MANFVRKNPKNRMVVAMVTLTVFITLTYLLYYDSFGDPLDGHWSYDNLTFEKGDRLYFDQETVEYAIVACRVQENHPDRQQREHWNHQLRQIKVLLKSAALLTKTTIHFNIVANSQKTYDDIVDITERWPIVYQQRIVIRERKEVHYPKNLEYIQDMFTQCSTERLFLADVLTEMDAVIFVDTDTLFMQPPEDLWQNFKSFERRQVVGVTPCLYMYDEYFKKSMPSFGFSGINAGVLLYNLTRVRQFPGDWTMSIFKILAKYKNYIQYGDQDILNILFSMRNTALAYEVGCEWNYRLKVCSLDRNRCPNAAANGVALLHGCATTFVNKEAPNIRAVFEAWEKFDLGSPETELISLLEEGLKKAKLSKRGCSKVSNIDDILLKGLKKHLFVENRDTTI